jgi:SAM-dependent methyltransferase
VAHVGSTTEISSSGEQLLALLGDLPLNDRGDRSWDGADRLLLETLIGQTLREEWDPASEALLLMNDEHGALLRVLTNASPSVEVSAAGAGSTIAGTSAGVSLLPPVPQIESFSDDVRVARLCQRLSENSPWVRFVASTEVPRNPSLVVMRVSPVEAILRAQIILLLGMRARGAQFSLLAAGLDRLLPSKTKTLLSMLGPTETLPGAYKAHAFVCRVSPSNPGNPAVSVADQVGQQDAAGDEPVVSRQGPIEQGLSEQGLSEQGPSVQEPGEQGPIEQEIVREMPVEIGGETLSFATGPYAFSAGRLDLGSRLLIEAISKAKTFGRSAEGTPGRVADLACGNGVVGIMAHRAHKLGSLYFSDVSCSAVALAERNAIRYGIEHAEFNVDTGFDSYVGPRFDAIVLNPPFHHHGGVDEELGAQLFSAAYGQLRVGGELWVVGNRHLGYQKTLQTAFGDCRLVTAHPKFVVLVAKRGATRLRTTQVRPRTAGRILGQSAVQGT